MRLWRYSGTLLSATGIIHIIYAVFENWKTFGAMFSDGMLNSVKNDITRAYAFWFLMIGIMLIMLGQTLQYYINKEQQPAPLPLGYVLLVFSITGCLFVPISGFWLFIPQSLIIILAQK